MKIGKVNISRNKTKNERRNFKEIGGIKNMDNKIGYAYISLEEYKELIQDNERLKILVNSIQSEMVQIKKEYESVEKTILNKVYKDENYYIKIYDGKGEYYHNELVKRIQSYGYISLDKINNLIEQLLEKYEKENGVNEDE